MGKIQDGYQKLIEQTANNINFAYIKEGDYIEIHDENKQTIGALWRDEDPPQPKDTTMIYVTALNENLEIIIKGFETQTNQGLTDFLNLEHKGRITIAHILIRLISTALTNGED